MGCLYRLSFPNGKAYIGITVKTAEKRFAEHRYTSDTDRADRVVNRALRKYGAENVRLETLVIAEWDYLVELEKKAIAAFGTFGRGGYNMTAGGEGAFGYRHTAEAKKKMSAIHKGNAHHTQPHSEESKAKMSAAAMGRRNSDEMKAKLSASIKGHHRNLGRVQTTEERRMRSAAQFGISKGASSGHVGVSFHKGTGKWRAHITKSGKYINLGYFNSIEEAAEARRLGEVAWSGDGR